MPVVETTATPDAVRLLLIDAGAARPGLVIRAGGRLGSQVLGVDDDEAREVAGLLDRAGHVAAVVSGLRETG